MEQAIALEHLAMAVGRLLADYQTPTAPRK